MRSRQILREKVFTSKDGAAVNYATVYVVTGECEDWGGGGDLKEDREAMKEEEGQEGKTNKDDARRKTKSIRKREKR